MTMTEETKVPKEVAGLLDDYAAPDVRANWASLATMLEERKSELTYLIARLQEAHAAHSVASHRMFIRLGDLPDDLDDALREASGWERLLSAVHNAGLWQAVEARDRTTEELDLLGTGPVKAVKS